MKWFLVLLLLNSVALANAPYPEFNPSDPDKPLWSEYYKPFTIETHGLYGLLTQRKRQQDWEEYWENRHNQFDTNVSACEQLQDSSSRSSCYTEVRRLEDSKNTELNTTLHPADPTELRCTTYGFTTTCREEKY